MASNYTGVRTATQAPSPTPGINTVPISTLPADGDNLNAASIAQHIRMLTDFGHYLNTVHEFQRDVNDHGHILTTRNFAGSTGSTTTYAGHRMGRTTVIEETWRELHSISGTSAAAVIPNIIRWSSKTNGGSTVMTVGSNSVVHGGSIATATLGSGSTNGHHAYIYSTNRFVTRSALMSIVLQVDVSVTAASLDADAKFIVGLRPATTSAFGTAALNEICYGFDATVHAANWISYINNGVGAVVKVDTGIPVAIEPAISRFWIQLDGSTTPEGSNQYEMRINDTITNTGTSEAPSETGNYFFGLWNDATGDIGTTLALNVGNVRFSFNRFADTKLY